MLPGSIIRPPATPDEHLMNPHLAARHWLAAGLVSAMVLSTMPRPAATESWIFRPSHYSHDPQTGERVSQYASEPPAYAPYDPNYLVSGYRHIRSSIRDGDGNFDHMHVVQTWGAGEWIRPYGEWLFPFRAGATPYGPWGNPQGPWTLPFGSWVNPYGQWNRLPYLGTPYLGQPPGGLAPPGTLGPPPGYGPPAAPPGAYGPPAAAPGAAPGRPSPAPHGPAAPGSGRGSGAYR
jgi:hypothetical protein